MEQTASLTNQFIIAMPALADPNFTHTVTYICEHNQEGAMGIVINRPFGLSLGEMLDHLEITPGPSVNRDQPVMAGGPVQNEHGFVLHTPVGDWDSSLQVTPDLALTASSDILSAIARGNGPLHYLVALGYAGWGAGQLEEEMASNAWLSGPADARLIFETPVEKRWSEAAASLGIDLNLLSSDVGHA